MEQVQNISMRTWRAAHLHTEKLVGAQRPLIKASRLCASASEREAGRQFSPHRLGDRDTVEYKLIVFAVY